MARKSSGSGMSSKVDDDYLDAFRQLHSTESLLKVTPEVLKAGVVQFALQRHISPRLATLLIDVLGLKDV